MSLPRAQPGAAVDPAAAPRPGDVDLDVSGLCRVRLRDAGPTERATVARQLGLAPEPARGEADLVLAYGPPPTGRQVLLGVEGLAATDTHLVLRRGSRKQPVEVHVPVDCLGAPCTVHVRPGPAPVPLLVPIVNLGVLRHGAAALHAAAFELEGTGVLATGWAKSGKTETLLALAGDGARVVGDEWVYATPDGQLTGLPEPVRLWSWHLDEIGALARHVRARDRMRLRALAALSGVGSGHDHRLPGLVRRLRHLLRSQQSVQVPVQRLFPGVERPARCRLDVLVLLESHLDPGVTVTPVEPELVADRLAVCLQEERSDLLAAYRAARYVQPDRRNRVLDTVEEVERDRLRQLFAGRPAVVVRHPYPFAFADLARAMRGALERA